MASAFTSRRYRFALGTALALAAATAFAEAPAAQVNAQEPIMLAQASGTSASANTAGSMAYDYPPLQAGVRKAATEGPEALRRYIHRTRMIYAWYYPDFVL